MRFYILLNKLRILFYYGVHLSKPFYPLRLLRNILIAKVYMLLKVNKYVLRGCEFAITFKCNFKCCHCVCARIDELDSRKELVCQDYKMIVRQAMRLGATSFGISGGEPFIRSDWQEIIKACLPKYNHIIISTNGYLFDEEKANACSKLGVDTINISLDSGIPELHDEFRRRQGSFSRAMNAINICLKYKIKVVINTVVHKRNLYTEGFKKILDFAEDKKILLHLFFAKAIGNFRNEDLMLDDEDIKAFQEITRPYVYAYTHHGTTSGSIKSNYAAKGCHGSKELLNFTPYGDVMHCANMHIYFGNVKNEPLALIRQHALTGTPFSTFSPCFLTLDRDFMDMYYPLMEDKSYIALEEFKEAFRKMQKKEGKDAARNQLQKN